MTDLLAYELAGLTGRRPARAGIEIVATHDAGPGGGASGGPGGGILSGSRPRGVVLNKVRRPAAGFEFRAMEGLLRDHLDALIPERHGKT